MRKITYVTGNWSKILSAKQILEPLGIEVSNVKMEILKNDTGLYVEALRGFPGPYTHYVDERIGEDGILKLLENVENRNACFIEAFAYCEYGKDPIVFKSVTKGIIAKEKSGKYGWSWDFIFIPDGYDKTMGNYPDEERCRVWNTDAYYELAKFLEKNNT